MERETFEWVEVTRYSPSEGTELFNYLKSMKAYQYGIKTLEEFKVWKEDAIEWLENFIGDEHFNRYTEKQKNAIRSIRDSILQSMSEREKALSRKVDNVNLEDFLNRVKSKLDRYPSFEDWYEAFEREFAKKFGERWEKKPAVIALHNPSVELAQMHFKVGRYRPNVPDGIDTEEFKLNDWLAFVVEVCDKVNSDNPVMEAREKCKIAFKTWYPILAEMFGQNFDVYKDNPYAMEAYDKSNVTTMRILDPDVYAVLYHSVEENWEEEDAKNKLFSMMQKLRGEGVDTFDRLISIARLYLRSEEYRYVIGGDEARERIEKAACEEAKRLSKL